jgi:hypothetical protein
VELTRGGGPRSSSRGNRVAGAGETRLRWLPATCPDRMSSKRSVEMVSQKSCLVSTFAGRGLSDRGLDFAWVVGTAVLTIPL